MYYWEAKIFDKPDTTQIGVGMTTKPYPLFRMPGVYIPGSLHGGSSVYIYFELT